MTKQTFTMTATGVRMTEQRQAQVGQAVLLTLAKQGVDMDKVRIVFTHEEEF